MNQQKPPIEQQVDAFFAHYVSSLVEIAGPFSSLYCVARHTHDGKLAIDYWAACPDGATGQSKDPVAVLTELKAMIGIEGRQARAAELRLKASAMLIEANNLEGKEAA